MYKDFNSESKKARGGEEQNTAFLADIEVTFLLKPEAAKTPKTARSVSIETQLINIYPNTPGS